MSNTNVKNKGKYVLCIIAIILGICMMSGCGKEEISFANTPCGAVDCVGKDKDTVRDDFLSVGFVNISEEVIEDLEFTEKDKYGEVESVSINGVIDFEGNTEFKNTSKVVIKYHSYKTIGMPFSSEEAKTMDADAILKTFEDAGFTEITIDEIYDLDPDVVTSEFENHITIDGESFFEKDERFPINAEVEIVTHRKYEKHTVKIIIDFVSNLIFSRYDVEFEIDDNTEILKHGKDAEFEYRLKTGKYTLTFESAESSSVKGTVDIDITGDTEVSYKISCHNDEVSVTTNYVENKGNIGENEAMVPTSAFDCKYEDYKDVEKVFKNAGFTNIKTEILYDIVWGWTDEGEVEKVSIDGKKDFKRGDIFSKDAAIVITYHMKEDDDPNKKEETKPDVSEPDSIVETKSNITIENNTDFASLMKITDQTDVTTIMAFVNAHEGDTIEFDGCIALMMKHEDYKTRFDVCMTGGNYNASRVYGPLFAFENVNYYDMNVSGADMVKEGMNFRITAEIIGFSEEGDYIILEPISLKKR